MSLEARGLLHRSQLERYQDGAHGMVPFIKNTPRCLIISDMGSGKSISTLTALNDLLDQFDIARILVVAPLRVAKKTWKDEIENWAHVRHLRFMFLDGPLKSMGNKIMKNLDRVDVWAVSCDKVKSLATLFKGGPHPWDTVVIDESTRFKNQGAARSKAIRLLTARPQRVILLTGTPMPNGYTDLWHQFYLLDRGQRLGTSKKAFTDRWFRAGSDIKPVPKKGAKEQIMRAISDMTFVLNPEEFTSVKKPLMNNIKLEMTADLAARYKKFEKEFILSMPLGETIKANNTAALATKLLQYASGAVYNSEMEARHVHDIKLDALRELREDNEGKPLLVAYNFQHEIARIKSVFPKAVLLGKDPKQIDDWNAGKYEVMIAHPKSAAHGLNLQFGGHILVWFSFGNNLEDYLQMNKRLPRPGQRNQVIIHHLILEGTADEIVMRSLRHKDHEQDSFQRALKDLIKATLHEAHR